MDNENVTIWKRKSGRKDNNAVYQCDELIVAFGDGKILPRNTANMELTCRVIETFNSTTAHLDLFDNEEEALGELIVSLEIMPNGK